MAYRRKNLKYKILTNNISTDHTNLDPIASGFCCLKFNKSKIKSQEDLFYCFYPRLHINQNNPFDDIGSLAITLRCKEVLYTHKVHDGFRYKIKTCEIEDKKIFTKTHPDGWTISAKINEDYYMWISNFEATHPEYGFVNGNFGTSINAFSKSALKHFLKYHKPIFWDYYDI